MQYLLLIYSDETAWESISEDERRAIYREYSQLNDDLRGRGKLVAGDELQPVATATSVRIRKGETLVSDGPFAETKEALGGYYLIEADTLDEAIEWAARIPSARQGTIEIRPTVAHAGGAT
ncbi:MAG TPA: YciI family protein [Gaiellaceae bacterium]